MKKFRFWCKGTSTNKNFDKCGWWTYPNFLLSKYFSGLSLFDDEDFVACQYTGINDKNGKEICEGDIIFYSNSRDPLFAKMKVIWDEKSARFKIVGKIYSFDLYYQEDYYGTKEVIGNIFENPDLIK